MSEQNDEQRNLRKILNALQKRLQVLEVQAAQQGYDAKPQIVNEIADIRSQISEIKARASYLPPDRVAPARSRNTLDSMQKRLDELEQRLSARSKERDQQSGQFTLFRTNVSQAFWYLAAGAEQKRPFIPAVMSKPQVKVSEDPSTFAWFDELLRDGLYLPNGENRPLTMVVAGPPGSGKTTLALEMCYRLAKDETGENPGRLFSLYISLDQDTDRLITNAERFGYEEVRQYIVDYDAQRDATMRRHGGNVAVYGRDRIMRQIEQTAQEADSKRRLYQIVNGAKKDLEERLKDSHPSGFTPDIVVVDSLNIVPNAEQIDLFQDFHAITSSGSKLVVFVIDSIKGSEHYAMWEYTCDFVIRLDYTTLNNYYIRTIEIVKARYQSHVWGKHQLKVYEKPIIPGSEDIHLEGKLRRSHPYRKEGGIFIYPSIHYYLSLYKKQSSNTNVTYAKTKPILKRVLETGLPEGRCTAFIGTRGGHKSHFGYLHLLSRISDRKSKESALIISLRDDEDMTAKTIDNIIKTEFNDELSRQFLEQENRLEILYFHPGYITPEEFFHRVFISTKRLRKNGSKLTVLFNSVDQLASRFPLCAKENIFIPGIIEFLTGEGATSIFIAVDEQGQPAEQYGLLPMADLILSFYPHRFKYEGYRQMLFEEHEIDTRNPHSMEVIQRMDEKFGEDGYVEAIVLQVVRFAGGEQAGARGILELVQEGDTGLYNAAGLHFTPMNPKIRPEPIVLSTQHTYK